MKRQLYKWLLTITLAAWTAAEVAAQTPMFMRLDGITGEVTQAGREGWVAILAFNHEVSATPTASPEAAPSKPAHTPLRVVIPHSRTLPPLMSRLVSQTPIPKVDFYYWVVLPSSVEQKVMEYRLHNVRVQSVRPWMPNVRDTEARALGAAVEVALAYDSIEWVWLNPLLSAGETNVVFP